ncbi:MAG: glycosyltransferase, partial [Phycisphaerae bacterium]|nr:glycosyltransferase [Phycisphaerae bacterium]MDW8262977.1 glycosyltransferase [Phycisphaerales bacterium]
MLPPVSIVIPSFNQGRYLERTLLSILRQNYAGRVEIIVSDGGSTDETLQVLRRFPCVRHWSERDYGIADATNKGLSVASGEILAIQSSDDFYLPDAIAHTVAALEQDGSIALASGCDVYLEPDGTSFTCSQLDDHRVDPRSLLLRRVLPQHGTFFRRELIDRIGLLRMDLAEGAEIDFWYRALHFFAGRFIPRHTAVYQRHPAQRTQTGSQWYQSLVRIVESNESDPVYGDIFRLSPEDKFNLYTRWQIQTAAIAGQNDQVRLLLDFVTRDARITEETRKWLALHGFLPKPVRRRPDVRHPNHQLPDFNWMWTDRDPGRLAAGRQGSSDFYAAA